MGTAYPKYRTVVYSPKSRSDHFDDVRLPVHTDNLETALGNVLFLFDSMMMTSNSLRTVE
jgi:hypothetical protein